jgi:iron complex outermembrane receptor protein
MHTLRFGALCAALVLPAFAAAQENLPAIIVEADRLGGSLTVPTTAQAEHELRQVPGSVQVVPDTVLRSQRAATVKDVLDYIPGVFAQPKWGEDTRLSIRGSGLSRNFHLRGVQLFMDGIPINTADGYGDFQEIDPSAYKFVEVYKGANALRYGANALGGAINFVTPSGRDAPRAAGGLDFGSFGFQRYQTSTAGVSGASDYFITGAFQQQDGFRNHSWGHSARGAANFGYQFSPDSETRFYLNANEITQRIPGSVTRAAALNSPRTAAAGNVINDQQRNVQSLRAANKTTLRFDDTKIELGVFGVNRHLEHPIFQWLDYRYQDYGGFVRMTDERFIGGYANRLIAGLNIHNGTLDNRQYQNLPGARKGPLLSAANDQSQNYSLYAENSFFFLPKVALVTAAQQLFAIRERSEAFGPLVSGRTQHSLFSPKVGLLWNVDPAWQIFGNISASAEAPSFGESSGGAIPIIPWTQILPQRAVTYEFGTRGRRADFTWDAAIYRAEIKHELMCFAAAPGACNVVNADRTLHQGVELGFGAAVLKSMFVNGNEPDKLWLNVAYTFSDFRFQNDATFGNNELPGAPRYLVRAELLYKHPSGFFAGPNMELVPTTYFVDSANTVSTTAYGIWGLRAGYEQENYSLFLDARNLSNETYIASVSIARFANTASALYEPGTGRALYAGFRLKY